MPERIQLRRTKGWRKPPGAVVVARPSRWGNPFRVGAPILDESMAGIRIQGRPIIRSGFVEDAAHAVDLFQMYVLMRVPFTEAEVRAELAGRDLACWCPLVDARGERVPCHADVLLSLANPEGAQP